jgi:3-oxoacyl-(acyl-carrier-protein) synthase
VGTIAALRERFLPATLHLREPDPECDLDYVPLTAREAKIDTVAVHGFAFGGQNAVTIFRRPTD